ncbi:hypothetical protein FRB91_005036 [Serendipita sp. 411]|nr:hypothetical protein FRB91_005036 [Serendipita sp. 411]
MPTYTSSNCKDTIKELVKINMRVHVQATRHMVFRILDSLLTRYRSILQELGPEFIKGYISLAEGEKDPRNLLIAFALDRVLLLEFDVKDFAEQFYDITFCYFPITFKAPVNDPYGVTGPDLVSALKQCLCASPILGPLGMPLFVEKLNAGTPPTKIDTLDTIAACLPVYGKAVCETFGEQLWTSLKVEIFQPVDSGVQAQAVNVTKILVQTCSTSEETGELEEITSRILRTTIEILKEIDKGRSQSALKVLVALIGSSMNVAEQKAQEENDEKARAELCIHFLTKVEILVESLVKVSSDGTPSQMDRSIAYSHALLRTISVVLDKKREKDHVDIPKYIERFVPRLYFLFFNNALGFQEGRPDLGETILVTDIAEIISTVVGCLDRERQESWINTAFEAYFRGKPGLIAFSHTSVPDTNVFSPIETSQTIGENLMPLFTSAVVALRSETSIPHHSLRKLLNQLALAAFTCENPRKKFALTGAVASILNKHAEECPEFIEADMEKFWSDNVKDSTLPVMKRNEALMIWSAVCQALVARNHPKAFPMVKKILGLFDDATISQHAARCFGQIPNLEGSTISKKNHAIIRLLYVQKLLNTIGPEIKANYTPAIASAKSDAYLTAVSTLTPSIPKGTYTQTIDAFIPLLLRGLELQDLALRANVIDSFVTIVTKNEKGANEVIATHLGTLIGAMLKNIRTEEGMPLTVRLKVCALRFLTGVAGMMNQEDIQPFKSRVLRELQVVLDDRSKAVRHEAVAAR